MTCNLRPILGIIVILGLLSLQISYGQLNQCTFFEGRTLAVIRADNECLGYADAKISEEGWTIVGVMNSSILVVKNANSSQ